MKKTIKKFLPIVLCLPLVLTSCGPDETSSNPSTSTSSSSSTPESTKATVTFVTDSSTSIIDPIVVEKNTTINQPEDPVKDGYRFVGWFLDSSFTKQATFPLLITKDTTLYAKYNEKVGILNYFKQLLNGYDLSPLTYVPSTMLATNDNNVVSESSLNYDFANSYVNVSSINYNGYGEQWNMVLDNLEQTMRFYNALSVVDSLSSTAIAAFNDYLDRNPGDTAHFVTKLGDYDVAIKYENSVLTYILGLNSAQYALSLNIDTGERIGRIQLDDANALKYVITENSYQFAIRYLGVRRAYFDIQRNYDNTVTGRIVEYLGIDGAFSTNSTAIFTLNNNYSYITGNKASGMMLTQNSITEMYETNTGRLVAYDVIEDAVVGSFDTLWFNLDDTTGINNVKVTEKDDSQGSTNNPNYVFVNNQANILKTKTILLTQTREYDIELRNRYNVYKNTENKYVVKEVKIPMLFIQTKYLDDLKTDIEKNNDYISNFALNVSNSIITSLTNACSTYVPQLEQVKDEIQVQDILDFIGEKY